MKRRNARDGVFRLALSALLLTLMLILGYVEAMLPLNIGVPGIKLGLSNGVLIFALYMLDLPTAFMLMALKVILSGLLFSGVSAMLYGLCGGIVSLVCMALLSRIHRLPIQAVSVAGGIMHNAGQIGLSLLILNLPLRAMLWYLLWLTLAGALCGFLTGTCARLVLKHLRGARLQVKQEKPEGKKVAAAVIAVVAAIALAVWFWPRVTSSAPQTSESTRVPLFDDGGHALQLDGLIQ